MSIHDSRELVGGIDAGGTSFRCILASGPDDIRAEVQFPTTTPEATLEQACAFFRDGPGRAASRIGVACFGPVRVDPQAADWGRILRTTKPGWSGADVAGTLSRATGKPVRLETDVTAAALGEQRWGAARGITSFVYVTVGTGIGAGVISAGRPVRGGLHPEAGHIFVPRASGDAGFAGVCPIHGDCVEGLASAGAIAARWGQAPDTLPDDHPAWEVEAHYLAHLAATLIVVTASQAVILGGGVSARTGLVGRVAARTAALLGAYLDDLDRPAGPWVLPPGLGLRAGSLGAVAVALAPDPD